jgi:cytochrome P450
MGGGDGGGEGVLDIFDPGFLANPWPAIAAARVDGPVVASPLGPAVIGYHEVDALLRDGRFRQEGTDMLLVQGVDHGPVFDWWSGSLVTTEGVDHARLRRLVAPLFSADAVRACRAALGLVAQELVAGLPDSGTCDVASELCAPFASRAMCSLLGIPAERAGELSDLSSRIGPVVGFDVADRLPDITAALDQAWAAIEDILASGVLSTDAPIVGVVERAAAELERSELIGLLIVVLFSGHEALRFQLGSAIEHLADAPAQWQLLRDDPSLAPAAATECLRFDPVFPAAARVAVEGGFELAGIEVEQGMMVFAATGGANRDPQVFASPEVLDITAVREHPPLVFGAGPHRCLGAALAPPALATLLGCLAERDLAMGVDGLVIRRNLLEGQCGPYLLPIRFSPSPPAT